MIPSSGTYIDFYGKVRYLEHRSDGYYYYFNYDRNCGACYRQQDVRRFTYLCSSTDPVYVRTHFPEYFL